jgi:dephospho-CoA kinase
MIVIGLTGSIASGKSTVLRMLSELGAMIIDSDRIGHKILEPHSEAWQDVIQTFGEEILNSGGRVDRAKLGKKVFANPQALEKLNQMTHPRIRRVVEDEIAKLSRGGIEVAVLEAPLLIEVGWDKLADQIWVTKATEKTSVQRLARRFGFSEKEAKARLSSQLAIEEKVKRADVVIDTDSEDIALVKAQVDFAWRHLLLREPKRLDLKQRLKQVLANRAGIKPASAGSPGVAVLVPIYEKEKENYMLFTKWVEEPECGEGKVSFPGGVIVGGESPLAAALRGSFNQIGLHPEAVEVLGEMDNEQTGNFAIHPFVALIPCAYEFNVHREAVEGLAPIAFWELLNPANVRIEGTTAEEGGLAYLYHIGDMVIQGATAKIVTKFFNLVFGLD